ncbi:glycerol dehydratase reactivase beta/small subunit family protein [Pseudoflavonifractor phocaeensis]|uniref:glycerol dehydratase reactivase beta/small subunit family protein n=1 Tax=Pseudoflavonifractor phocaeensis TaxID=1870988 RepID=UPI001957CD44|nr:glycerol dehydratase reactivase beta/small subunit family protein [Pseudoflavonifractor phocaeensis]MBM6869429.1 glycerol dehydratase reactivase beta/small subunit family protein [Pseudoflavonifractor phocaeensis]MBM6937630.1 glycerol dehydratase reactivase beta/small subunit family protein [Pseudoflavonifractor phocaeensis]
MRPVEQERPTIKVFVASGYGRPATLLMLLHGIEEEGIPFQMLDEQKGDAVALAWEASHQSRLEVGVGLDHDTLALHYGKLKADQPLFTISARSPEEQVRAIGANAARLVKKMPFKPVERPEEVNG